MQIGTPRIHVFDAFGNAMTARASIAGVFTWRGGEGRVTDKETNLVLMQATHYDPTLGRFLQADTLRLAGLTTQGMNRYIYTENDPVNFSDPSGRLLSLVLGILVGIAFLTGLYFGLSLGNQQQLQANGGSSLSTHAEGLTELYLGASAEIAACGLGRVASPQGDVNSSACANGWHGPRLRGHA